MWSHVSHQPPISKNIGEIGLGQLKASRIQKRSASPSFQSIEKFSSPWYVPSTSLVFVSTSPPFLQARAPIPGRVRPRSHFPNVHDYRLSLIENQTGKRTSHTGESGRGLTKSRCCNGS